MPSQSREGEGRWGRAGRVGPIATGVFAIASALVACEDANQGDPPPVDRMFFPSGMLLDPRVAEGEEARYLFVANGNNDLSYNAGTLVSIDLQRYFDAWSLGDDFTVDPYCGDDRCVQDVGSRVSDLRPCRRLALLPQVVECTENPFIGNRRAPRLTGAEQEQARQEGKDASDYPEVGVGPLSFVRTGDFATLITSSCEKPGPGRRCEAPRLWLPVRGDPSLTYVDLTGDPDGEDSAPLLDCWTETPGYDDSEESYEANRARKRVRCDPDHRLTRLRNDADLQELGREPYNMLISPSTRFAYVAHSDGDNLSLLDLDGIGDSGKPAIVDQSPAFPSLGGFPGGLGLAERPCSPGDNEPSITLGCTRPLVYAAYRYSRLLVSFTVQGVEPDDPSSCAGPSETDQKGKIVCDARVRSQTQIFTGGLDPGGNSFAPVLGDIAFADDRGDELLVVQTSPGALLKLDTSVGPDGQVVDSPSAPPLEVCDQPTRMKLYREAGQRYALIACYVAAEIFVVDLDAFRLLTTIQLGTGPFEIEVDRARRLLYVANNLEGSISIVDLAADRSTRFTEIGRIGLQEPFSR
ncbi:MAG: hypothetical protein IAG13_26345 [Deltaproteobacteria bacterium]|nr:hypothetical protein [Nannocystaceae bacterium]